MIYNEAKEPIKVIGTTQNITEQVELQKHNRELANLIEQSSNEIYVIDAATLRYHYVNRGASKALGYTPEELVLMSVFDINPYLTKTEAEQMRQEVATFGTSLKRTIHRRKDGSLYHVQAYIHPIKYNNVDAFVIFDTDITNMIDLEMKHKMQSTILDHIHDSVISINQEGKVISSNKGTTRLLGYKEEDIIGQSISLVYDIHNALTFEDIQKRMRSREQFDIEAYLTTMSGERIICNISVTTMRDEASNLEGIVLYSQDITDKKEAERLLKEQSERFAHQANHDTLTNLPNRTLFKDRLNQTIASSNRNNEMFALLFIDLDQFKKINDSLGHHVGDEVLIEAAKRLKSALREEDTLARLGGDEFTVILKNIKSIQAASVVANKIINNMREKMIINGHPLYLSSSIGISIYPNDSTNEHDLLKFADTAMYKAKDDGRDNFQFYASEMTTLAFERVVMESSIRMAIALEQFIVYFQPQINPQDDSLVGMEALVRWQHPQLGLIPPGKFIPIAEETGLIIEIDKIVMRKAMEQFSRWYQAGYKPGVLALNLSMKQLSSSNFVTDLYKMMNNTDFKAKWLELEITEGQVMQNPEASIEKLNQLSGIGVELAIDDFGTGYSSLAYLKKLPLDKLKIDQSFVRDIPSDEEDMAITRAIIALAKSLNLKTIAEGVEDEAQKEFLMQNGCDTIQGYFYSRPLPPEQIEEMLRRI